MIQQWGSSSSSCGGLGQKSGVSTLRPIWGPIEDQNTDKCIGSGGVWAFLEHCWCALCALLQS